MSAINHMYVENVATPTTASSTFADISSMSIASGNFTAGKKYLLLANILCSEDSSGLYQFRLAHGGTAFADSSSALSVSSSSHWQRHMIFEVWTAVGGEAISLQHAVTAGNGNVSMCSLLAINLSDDLTENTDWFFAERSNDDTLTSTPTDGASVTFTPAVTSPWLVLSSAQYDPVDGTSQISTNITRSGEASSTTPSAQTEAISSTTWVIPITLIHAFSLGNASNTLKEVSVSPSNTGHVRLHSKIFALNLAKFQTQNTVYTAADTALNTTDFGDQVQSLSLSPSTTGDVVILAGFGFDKNASGNLAKARIQIDGADAPSTEDVSMRVGADNADEDYVPFMFVDSLSAGTYTIDLGASVSATTSTPAAQYRTIIAFSMELASQGANLLVGKLGKLLQGKL